MAGVCQRDRSLHAGSRRPGHRTMARAPARPRPEMDLRPDITVALPLSAADHDDAH